MHVLVHQGMQEARRCFYKQLERAELDRGWVDAWASPMAHMFNDKYNIYKELTLYATALFRQTLIL